MKIQGASTVKNVFIAAIILMPAFAGAHFSTPSFRTNSISHSDAPLADSHAGHASAPFVSRGNPNLYSTSKADELRYRNANFKSQDLGIENRNLKSGTHNDRFQNMKLKFEDPQLRGFDFNSIHNNSDAP